MIRGSPAAAAPMPSTAFAAVPRTSSFPRSSMSARSQLAAAGIAGFGKIRWLEAGELRLVPPAAGLPESEAGIVRHMNEDHADALRLYAQKLLGLPGGDWRMTGIDAEGLDLRHAGQVARLPFDAPLASAAEARKVLVALVGRARAIGSAPI